MKSTQRWAAADVEQQFVFIRLLLDGDVVAAAERLAWEEQTGFEIPGVLMSRRANLLAVTGKKQEAIELLLMFIPSGGDVTGACRVRLAEIYLSARLFDDAQRVYQWLLDDLTPHVVNYFHSTAAYRIAWLLARKGDPAYREYLDRAPVGLADFIIDELVHPHEIVALFEARLHG